MNKKEKNKRITSNTQDDIFICIYISMIIFIMITIIFIGSSTSTKSFREVIYRSNEVIESIVQITILVSSIFGIYLLIRNKEKKK